jgi:hypothetical protein
MRKAVLPQLRVLTTQYVRVKRPTEKIRFLLKEVI